MAMRDWPRHQRRVFPLTGGRVEVYRRDDRLQQGVCMSIYVGDRELMRWDLQPGTAHVHHAIRSAPRLYYPRHWPFEQLVELAVDQLAQHPRAVARMASIRRPDAEELAAAARWAAQQLTDLAAQG